ncbi:HupE/UreJ family protein [Sphingobium sp. MK2]|uniref:HupE/UreJ family protein n=1 Tax=Sphingobium sp. MK2 TaxID=3116540 RepID=UPI0032E35AA6
MKSRTARLQRRIARATSIMLLLSAVPAAAHPGHDAMAMADGLLHPLTGIDHFVTMVAIGLLAARQISTRLFVLPLAFVTMMALGMQAGAVSFGNGAEIAIAVGLLLTGCALLIDQSLPVWAVGLLAGSAGLFHGMAHVGDKGGAALQPSYIMGVLIMTMLLHGAGAVAGRHMLRLPVRMALHGRRIASLGTACTGLFILMA